MSPYELHVTRIELLCLLRHMRYRREDMAREVAALEERRRGRHNGDIASMQLVLDAELSIVDGIIAKLWRLIGKIR